MSFEMNASVSKDRFVPIFDYNEETSQYTFDEERFNAIIAGECAMLPVAVVSIVGDYRKGKSFLLNFLLRYLERYDSENWIGEDDEPLSGFPWETGSASITKGIVIWPKPLILTRKDGTQIAVLLVDTQGFFDDTTSFEVVRDFFVLSTFISSLQIYNLFHQIQANDISRLAEFNEYSKITKSRAGCCAFQRLMFLVRDWRHPFDFPFGWQGGSDYLLDKIEKQKSRFGKEWDSFRECFSQIECFLMPNPSRDSDDPLFNGSLDELDNDFKVYLKQLIPPLLSPESIPIKKVYGEEQKLWQIVAMFRALTQHLNDFGSLQIGNLTRLSEDVILNNAISEAVNEYVSFIHEQSEFRKMKKEERSKELNKSRLRAIDEFKKRTHHIAVDIWGRKFGQLLDKIDSMEKFFLELDENASWWSGDRAAILGIILGGATGLGAILLTILTLGKA